MKTSELTGAALDWAVAKCEGGTGLWYDSVATYWITIDGKDRALSKGWAQSYQPSTDWGDGGPIIEREKIGVNPEYLPCSGWVSDTKTISEKTHQHGPTPLVAAMRCYVASVLGDEVEIPKGLA